MTSRDGWGFRLLTVGGALVLCLLALELVLRLGGFRYELRVSVLQNTAPDLQRAYESYRIDRDLIWTPRDYDDRLRLAQGARLLFLGDSCTEYASYPRGLARLIGRDTGAEVRIANLAVAGWTSHQGLRQLERELPGLSPRVVTLYYGWNDHWISIGVDDREIERINRSPLFGTLSTRVAQLLTKGWIGLRSRGREPALRVPPEQFRDNLTRAVRTVRANDAVPVLITAPSSHEKGREPAYLARRWMPDLDRLVPTHRRYVEIVRQVAAAEQAPLVDLATSFDELPREQRYASFMEDGIHFSPEGNRRAALMLYNSFRQQELIELVADAAQR